MADIRVRIAPSPTGIPHIGTTRTALFNFLFAKRNNGKFILRIEDTDRARLVPESEEKIYEILEWLGLKPDEKYKQSDRKEIYQEHAKLLQEKGLAYDDNGALRFRIEKTGETNWTDLIGNKKIIFKNETQEDFVILKSDGFPTYNFANVVDDHLMQISHVIRGDEFISSTPKHIMLYKAFDWWKEGEHPEFAHLPVIVGPDKKKLSKRHGAKSVLEYRDEGYLKGGILNYMAMLGWKPAQEGEGKGEIVVNDREEFWTLKLMTKTFDLKDVNTGSPIFDIKKLEWINGKHIRKTSNNKLALLIWDYLKKDYPLDRIKKTIPLVKERMNKLSEFKSLAGFLLQNNPPEPQMLTPHYSTNISGATISRLENLPDSQWTKDNLDKVLTEANRVAGTATKDFYMDLRGTVAGSSVTPPITESIEILGKEKTLERLKKGNKLVTQQEVKKD